MHMKKILPLVIVMLVFPFLMKAQVTTSSITGIVKNSSGSALAGASITATHTATGTIYTTATRAGGRFDISNMKPGGPYTITATFVGFEPGNKQDIFLELGESQSTNFVLTDKTTKLTEVVVAGRRNASSKNGSETTISRDKLAILPTIGRNLNDFLRYTPQTKLTSTGGISVGGQNNRFNGFLIDGAVNNDVFGVSDQATNGGRAGVTPISIDAIDQIVVQISPYDAALGNFTGGAINAITKSGTNNFHGSAYFIYRNQNFSGKTPGNVPDSARVKLADFKNQTYGFTLGGPIIKNKAFFFLNLEKQHDNRPQPATLVNPLNNDGSIRYNIKDSVEKVANYIRTKYGYEPGDYINNPDDIERTNINSRFDFNLSAKNKLMASYRYTKASRINPSRSTSNSINFVNGAEYFPSTTHSGNLELNTKFNNKINNKFRVSFTDVVDDRAETGSPFPKIVINAFNSGPSINIGSEISSTANLLKQRIINFYDAFKIYAGRNAITIGADIDFNKSTNLFINRNFGEYTYAALGPNGSQIGSLQAFMEDRGPSRYRRGYSLVDGGNKSGDVNTNSAANFKSRRIGFFVNDDIKVSDKLTLTFGIRGDKTSFLTDVPEDKFFNDSAAPVISRYYDMEGAKSGQKFLPKWQFSPRFGFKYVMDDENLTIRGGFGVFGGRTPLVWPGGVYQNNGITIGLTDTSRTSAQLTAPGTQYGIQLAGVPLGFRPDVNGQLTQADFGLSPTLIKPQGDQNVVAKNFHLPAVFKISLAADKKLDKGWTVSVEGLYTKNIYEVDWRNLNFLPPASISTGPDSRTVYSFSGNPNKLVYRPYSNVAAIRNPYGNVILVRNTEGQKGFAYNFTLTIDKQTRKGFNFSAAYTYGNSQVHNEGTSSINTSNWNNMEAVSDRNALPLTTSDFDLGHRIFALVSKKFTYAREHMATTIAFTYNGQSGNPYSYTMSNRSFIGDGVTNNDLMYIPLSRTEMDNMVFVTRLTGATAAQNAADVVQEKDEFETFIQSDKYLKKHRGQYAERNAARTPFTHIVDMSLTQEFSVKTGAVRHALSVRVDIFNFTNLINKSAGRQYSVGTFDQAQVVSFEGFTGSTPQYKFIKPTENKVAFVNDGVNPISSSRWNGQLTFRYSF